MPEVKAVETLRSLRERRHQSKSAVTSWAIMRKDRNRTRLGIGSNNRSPKRNLATEHSQPLSTHRMSEDSIRITGVRVSVTIAPPSKDSVPESAKPCTGTRAHAINVSHSTKIIYLDSTILYRSCFLISNHFSPFARIKSIKTQC